MRKRAVNHGLLVLLSILIMSQLLIGGSYAIKNGATDGDDHPYVCWIATWDGVSEYMYLGTGSLISPKIVLTAGHMTQPPEIAFIWVTFEPQAQWIIGESGEPEPDSHNWLPVDSRFTHPSYSDTGERGITDWLTHDVGVLVLQDPVDLDKYASLPTLGLVDTLPNKAGVDLVGYGVQYQARGLGIPPPGNWGYINLGYRYTASAQLLEGDDVISDDFMRLTTNPAQGKGGTCYGDSGGPILLGGTDIVLGVCSWGTNPNCAGISYEQRIDAADILEWLSGKVALYG